jgi:hypothetical protein
LRVEFRGGTVASDAGLLLLCELDERVGLNAAFTQPTLYEALERRGVRYAIRLPANDVLERQIEDLLTRPWGRPSHAPLAREGSFSLPDRLLGPAAPRDREDRASSRRAVPPQIGRWTIP